MVNRAATRNSAQQAKNRADQRSHRMLYKPISFWEPIEEEKEKQQSSKSKSKDSKPKMRAVSRCITLLTTSKKMLDSLHLHEWLGRGRGVSNTHLDPKHVCPRVEYGDERCNICESESKFACNPDQYRLGLGYVHDFVNKVFRKRNQEGKIVRIPWPLIRVILFPARAEGCFDKLDALAEDGVLTKVVLKIFQEKGPNTFTMEEASERIISKLPDKGIVPKETRLEAKEWDADYTWPHLLNIAVGTRFEHWGVEKPVFEDKGGSESDADESYPEEDEEDDEYNEGADEDEDDDEKGRRASKKGSSSAGRSKPSSKPAAKSKSKPAAKSKRKVDEDDGDDEDEGHWDDQEDDDEENYDEDEEEERPVKKKTTSKSKPTSKTKSKPAAKPKKKSPPPDEEEEEDEEDLDEEDDLADDFDDYDEDDEDEEEDDD